MMRWQRLLLSNMEAPFSQLALKQEAEYKNCLQHQLRVRLTSDSKYIEIITNQLSGGASIDLPTKIGSGRGALKVDGLDNFNPNANLKLNGNGKKKGGDKKKKCC